jgi:hypothetical protein
MKTKKGDETENTLTVIPEEHIGEPEFGETTITTCKDEIGEPANILTELNELLTNVGVTFETGAFGGKAPEEYVVIVPLADQLNLFANNRPETEVQEARLSLYCKGNFIKLRNRLTKALLESDFTITDRRYVGYEESAKLHHYAIEVAKNYELEE